MYTTCTHCQTRFRLSAAQLTAAQGNVRCGKCHEVFDAYEALEGAEVAPQMTSRPAPEPTERQISSIEAADPTILPMQVEDRTTPELEISLEVEDEPITSAPNLKAGSRKSPPPPIDDLFAAMDDDEPAPLPLPEPLGQVDAVLEAAMSAPEPVPMYADEVGGPASFAHVDDLKSPPAPPQRPRVSGAWWLGVVILVLVLGVQLVNMERATLSQNPVIGPSLQALYTALGWPLSRASSVSEWNVGALNVTTDPDNAGALSITGSLTNGARGVQPWPLLRVVLTDRFGAALRSRDFKPAEYLSPGQSTAALTPGLAARFRLDVVDPGADAVGFSLSPCLDVPAGRVCSSSTTNDAE
ncbi:MAG TPA: DUF3426 domain-containing protein [Gammaproteobacteria bacterium]|jgi:predicted Zn finger-like uncharacterized protein